MTDERDTPRDASEPADPPGPDAVPEWGTPVQDPDVVVIAAGPEPVSEGDPTGQDTEWFAFDADAEFTPALPRRLHHVTAVVVGHDGEVWLPAVLTTLAHQERPADDAVGVDTGSTDGTRALLRESLGEERVVDAPPSSGFGSAVAAGLAARASTAPPAPADAVEWVWLLHDDSAPDAGCLASLLDTADDNPSVAILGPKVLGWHDRRLLLEVGVTVTGSGRRVTGLERGEHDQGQHDGTRDVLAVGSAGMLVRRDVWERLEGFDPTLPLFRDDLDFCWRAQRAGERVLIATDAVLHHREATAHGRRADDIAPRPHRADREASVHVLLAHTRAWLAPLVALRLLIASLGRSVVYLLGKDVAAARDEVGAVLALALHPSRITASRALIRRTTTLPASAARHLRPSVGSQTRQVVDMVTGVLTTSRSASTASVSALESGPSGEDADYLEGTSSGLLRRLLTAPVLLVVALLAIVAVAGTRGLWLGDGVLQGGALLPAPAGAADLWETYLRSWHDVGAGSTTPSPPYLTVLAALAFLLLGKAPAAVSVALLLGIPLAGLAAYVTMKGLVPQPGIRAWAAAAYALLPAMTGAVSSGRIGTTILAIALPFALRSLVRISSPRGTYRRAAGTALLLAIVMSVAPGVWAMLLVGVALGAVWLVRRPDGPGTAVLVRLAIALLAPVVLLLPWSWYVLLHPSLLLLEPGLNSGPITDPNLTPWALLLLHPGGPGMTPVWLSAGLVAAGLLALLRRDRLSITGGFAVLGALALLFGLLQVVLLVTPPGVTEPVRPWPGQATLVLGLALIAMAAVAVHGLRDRFIGTNFSLSQPVALVLALAAVLAPVLTSIWFVGGLPSVVRKASVSPLPAFVAADAASAQAPRTLVVSAADVDRVDYNLLNGIGLQLGDAETGPPAEQWQALDPYVAALVSGRGGDEVAALAGYGVRYVLLAPGSTSDLIPVLDSEPGLRRLSSAGGEVLWRVAGVTTRARVVQSDSEEPVGIAEDGLLTADPYLSQLLPEGVGDRALVIGAAQDPGWSAVAVAEDGARTPLSPVVVAGLLDWSTSYVVPEGAPYVDVVFDDTARSRWLLLELGVLLVLIVMALPERRRVDPDPDTDPDREIERELEREIEHAPERGIGAVVADADRAGEAP